MNTHSPRKLLLTTAIDIGVGALLTGLMLLYSQNFTFVGIIDATLVASVLLFALGWFFYISNNNVFDLVIYGTRSFFTGVLGKRMKKTYIEYVSDKTKIEPFLYHAFWLASLLWLVVCLVFYAIYKF